jgi:hypothetical protein
MNTVRLAIVGGGPNCTYALERLAALAAHPPQPYPLSILIFDRHGAFGCGAVHDFAQCKSSYLNRVASQIAFAADESIAPSSDLFPPSLRPTFSEWAQRRGPSGHVGLRPTDVPRRYLHGEALKAAFELYVDRLRGLGVLVERMAEDVTDISLRPGRDGFMVHSSDGRSYAADRLLLATGHGDNEPEPERAEWVERGAFIPQPYPLLEQLGEEAVRPGRTVGIEGMGLTALDIVLHLSEGRGGQFEPATPPDQRRRYAFRYRPSGLEPSRIVPFGPSGLFAYCRPENEKALDPSGRGHSALEHKGVFLTTEAVAALRRTRGRQGLAGGEPALQLDFEADIMPLVLLELAFVHYRTAAPALSDPIKAAAAPRYRLFLASPGDSAAKPVDGLIEPMEAWIRSYAPGTPRFDWRATFHPLPAACASDPDRWREAATRFMREDLAAAAQGNLSNPLKAALDGVWRDLRAALGAATDFGGLTPASQRAFIAGRLRDYNRQSNGTGEEPMAKLLALVEADIVDLSVGPDPRLLDEGGTGLTVHGTATRARIAVDHVIEGRAHPFDALRDRSPLYRNLLRREMVRLCVNQGAAGDEPFVSGGIDVSRDHHPRDASGAEDRRITILGAPIERIAFFQLSAARPGSGSQVLAKADAWARELLADVTVKKACDRSDASAA